MCNMTIADTAIWYKKVAKRVDPKSSPNKKMLSFFHGIYMR